MIQAPTSTHLTVETPVGPLTLTQRGDAIVRLAWGAGSPPTARGALANAGDWLRGYFLGEQKPLAVPLDPDGTDFQRRVWRALSQIPFGQVATYSDIARQLGSSPRAVGGACGANPIPILIPCHRVVALGGGLGGYSGNGGLATKRALLELESAAGISLTAQAA